ncbi:MAG TPA: carbon-nitrogen hydrolase family protein [Spirochaetota bacterium]|nr:carbon-nitrogen hydrolase family protein [Spirochaetota bacterium]
MSEIRVILGQKQLGVPVTRGDINDMLSFKPHFVCFPEYFYVSRRLGNHGQTQHNQHLQVQRIRLLSKALDCVVIGGTMPEVEGGLMYNTSYICQSGKDLGFYRKKNLFFAEEGKITPGTEYKTFSAYGITFGVLICADVFNDESFLFMKEHGVRIIFSPTFSPAKTETVEEKYARDNAIYVRGAGLAEAVIVKVCGVPSEYKNILQARSLVADKEKVIYRVLPEEENIEKIIKITLDI